MPPEETCGDVAPDDVLAVGLQATVMVPEGLLVRLSSKIRALEVNASIGNAVVRFPIEVLGKVPGRLHRAIFGSYNCGPRKGRCPETSSKAVHNQVRMIPIDRRLRWHRS